MERNRYLTDKAFRRFLGASILTALSAMLGNIVDGIIVSHMIDYNAMSAISLSKSIIQANYTFYQLIGLGASILVAKALGENQHERVNNLFTLTLAIIMTYGVAESLIGLFCPDLVVNSVCSSPALHDYATDYFRPLLIGTPLFMLVYFFGAFTAIDGAPRLVSRAMLVDNMVNLAFDCILIKLAHMGVMGSSIATLIGHATALAIISTHYLRGDSQYTLVKLQLKSHFAELIRLTKEICSSGLPFALASICMTLYLFFTQSMILSSLGKEGLFVFSVMINIMLLYNMFVAGACSTMQQLAALQLGMNDHYGHRLTTFAAFRFLNASLLIACVVLTGFPGVVARLFDCPPELLSECSGAVRIYAIAFWLYCLLYLLMVNYKLIGHSRLATFISLSLSLGVVPVMWTILHTQASLIWWSNLASYSLVLLVIIICTRIIRNSSPETIPLLLIPRKAKNPTFDTSFLYTPESANEAFSALSSWLEQSNSSSHTIFRTRVIAEELMNNIVTHNHPHSIKTCIDLRVTMVDDTLTLTLTDDQTPFNPTTAQNPQLGLLIANGEADSISHRYQFGQNITMVTVKNHRE